MTGRDFQDEKMLTTLVVRLFPQDLERLKEVVEDNGEKYDSVSHAARCAIQAFIRQWGDV